MSIVTEADVFDVLEELLFVFDETGQFVDWNRATAHVTGYSEAELATMTPVDFFEGDDTERLSGAISELLETGSATVEAELVTADGDRIPYEFRAHRLETGDDTARYAGIGRDISERKQVERERREMLDRMRDALLSLDADWCITYTNERGADVLSNAIGRDLTPEELEGRYIWEEIPEAVDTTFYEKYHEAVATQETVTFEEYYEPLDTWFDVRAFPSETGLSVYFSDVTERHRQRKALGARERVLHEMYAIVADRERTFHQQVEALLALGRAELGVAYGTLSRIDGEEYTFEIVDAADDSIQAGDVVPLSATNCEVAASTEQTLVLADVARDAPAETDRAGYAEWGISCYIGTPVYVEDEVYGTFCFYDTEPRGDRFTEWEVTLVDLMSQWVNNELQRQRSNKRLARQNEKLEQFASIVSHDLRNPLNVLQGRLQLAEETGDAEEFDHCRAAIERMTTLIDDILSLARAGAVIDETEPVDLASLAEACWANVAVGEATLRVDAEGTVRADRSRLQQLLENLLRNAVEHGSEDEDATVTVTVGDLPGGFYVADDGPGIPAEDREQVFESGYTTATGTGLGLAMVKEIADAHGWAVAVTAGEEGGARFEFTDVRLE